MHLKNIIANLYKKNLVGLENKLFYHNNRNYITTNQQLLDILEFTKKKTDISDHLQTLFLEALSTSGQLLVELGTRGGESTFALQKVTELSQGTLVSVDIEVCDEPGEWNNWKFVNKDDLVFAKEFTSWAKNNSLPSKIDFLLIDTSHEYEHTKLELNAWLPHVAKNGKVALHDTNMQEIYKRKDGSLGLGWNNDRGVIRALEEYLGVTLDEKHNFDTIINEWLVKHWANCSGLTILQRCQVLDQ